MFFKVTTVAAVAALALAFTAAPKPALAENGQNAAAIIGGLAVGAIVGSQLNNNNGYRERRHYRTHYRTRYRECRIVRREYEDRYGRLRVRRVEVCD